MAMSINTKMVSHLTVIGLAVALSACVVSPNRTHREGDDRYREARPHYDGQANNDRYGDHDRHRDDDRRGSDYRFSGDDRRIVLEYYSTQARRGFCPPGLEKKRNGCQPPGQARTWRKGHPLAQGTSYYDLPRELRVRLSAPPPDYRYVQVAGDILLIAIGTSIVIDAIEDIAR